MQEPLQITFRGLDHSDAIERRLRAKVAKLEKFYDQITSCHVLVERKHKHHHKGNLWAVRIELRLPDQNIVAGGERSHRRAHEDVYVAIRDAFDAAVRQVEDYARRRRGDEKWHAVPDHGRVVRLFSGEGYGFVERPDGTQVYFHENSVVGGQFQSLTVGDEVRIVEAEPQGDLGPQASTVTPIGKHHLVSPSSA